MMLCLAWCLTLIAAVSRSWVNRYFHYQNSPLLTHVTQSLALLQDPKASSENVLHFFNFPDDNHNLGTLLLCAGYRHSVGNSGLRVQSSSGFFFFFFQAQLTCLFLKPTQRQIAGLKTVKSHGHLVFYSEGVPGLVNSIDSMRGEVSLLICLHSPGPNPKL